MWPGLLNFLWPPPWSRSPLILPQLLQNSLWWFLRHARIFNCVESIKAAQGAPFHLPFRTESHTFPCCFWREIWACARSRSIFTSLTKRLDFRREVPLGSKALFYHFVTSIVCRKCPLFAHSHQFTRCCPLYYEGLNLLLSIIWLLDVCEFLQRCASWCLDPWLSLSHRLMNSWQSYQWARVSATYE